MTRDELKEKVAANAWERMRQENIRENDDDLGPWFTPNPEWEDLPEAEHEGHYLRLPYLVDACAAIALVGKECAKVAESFEFDPPAKHIAAAILTLTGEK